ncbi:unnamed protein product [Rangifer tarandus platyrhynchus]|uniref:Uncharacterized protein n=1 Tax=Rangifer tarandus platyrhynchus TaxID=3082113 RepID=A0AC59Z3Q1_RANTA
MRSLPMAVTLRCCSPEVYVAAPLQGPDRTGLYPKSYQPLLFLQGDVGNPSSPKEPIPSPEQVHSHPSSTTA